MTEQISAVQRDVIRRVGRFRGSTGDAREPEALPRAPAAGFRGDPSDGEDRAPAPFNGEQSPYRRIPRLEEAHSPVNISHPFSVL